MMWKGTSAGAHLIHLVGIASIISMVFADTRPSSNASNSSDTRTLAVVTRYSNATIFGNDEVAAMQDDGNGNDNDPSSSSSKGKANGRLLQHAMRQRKIRGGKSAKGQKRGNNNNYSRPNQRPNNPPNRRPYNNNRPRPAQQQQQQQNQSRPRSSSCFSIDTYNAIDDDIANIANNIRNDRDKSHFLGGIVRLAAHDFMDYDRRSFSNPMGPDGCYDPYHANNAGLETIWCRNCALKVLYETKYSHLSRADYWIAAANAVVRQTSIDTALDLKDTFKWGRKDRGVDVDSCRGSGDRLPTPSGCGEIEDVFLTKMGLGWTDAVALLGGHTLGRGGREHSGHEGTWASSDKEAQVFDKSYYAALFTESWRPRNMGRQKQDWTTGRGNNDNTQMMLNTDMCLVFDIDEHVQRSVPCCSQTDRYYSNGQNECVEREAARRRCPMYSRNNPRRAATEAVREMLGGAISSRNNAPFYIAFARAWRKATMVGQGALYPLAQNCN